MRTADRRGVDRGGAPAEGPASRPGGLGPCAAPAGALYFQPDGKVLACCGSAQILGSVTGPRRMTLGEIWEGASATALREAMAVGDLRRGCDECAHHIDAGRREASLASRFDHIVPALGDGRGPVLIDFALSSTCNLQCVMCNGELSSAIRTQREGRPRRPSAYDDRFFEELRGYLPGLRYASFKGGEPFLAREARQVWDDLRELAPECRVSVTTNGTQLSPEVEQYVRDLRMHLVVSIDGADARANEAIRVGTDHAEVIANIRRFIAITGEVGSTVSLSFCLMATNWREAAPLLDLAEELDVDVAVIWVNQPHRYDLLQLPRHELVEIRRLLGEDDRPGRFSRQAGTWTAILERLDEHLSEPAEAPVSLGGRPQRSGDIEALVAELRAWSGVEPVVVRCDGEVVAEVDLPSWAGWTGAGGWVGSSRTQILGLLWEATGSDASYDSLHRDDGVDDVAVVLSGGAWEGNLRVLLTNEPQGSVVLLAPAPVG